MPVFTPSCCQCLGRARLSQVIPGGVVLSRRSRGRRFTLCNYQQHVELASSSTSSSTSVTISSHSVSSRQQSPQQASLDVNTDNQTDGLVVTTFKWPAALGGSQVSIVGSFNGWTTPLPLGRVGNGDFVRSVGLPAGSIQFKYIVDEEWLSSPCEQLVADGQGNYNNYRLIQTTAVFTWHAAALGGDRVLITGDWNSYGELVPLQRDSSTGLYQLQACLPPGTYTYCFLVDDTWQVCPNTDTVHTETGLLANRLEVKSPPAYSIFYATGWKEAVVRVRMLNKDGTSQHLGWREVPMHSTASRAQPKGGTWKMAVIGAPNQEQGGGGLEFYVTNADGTKEDRPSGGGAYRLFHPGGFKLRSGRVFPFPKATQPPMMLVSDLDGTMVGDSEEAHAMTAEFCQYWEENSAMAGCVLVYNTGRSLGSFVHLFQERAGGLALPDVLITAVGTKIFRLDTEGGTRGTASGVLWREDLQWARSLDAGWNLAAVKRAAESVVQSMLGEAGEVVHWLDQGTEHPHRIALTVRSDVVHKVVELLKRGVEAAGVQAQVIVSGVGDWRYVDCVSAHGGKLAALEYVRSLYGIARERCVASGDSGNDVLMLGGRHPAIVVGNAQPELVQWVLSQPQATRLVMSQQPLGRGLLEGLARHGLF